MAYRWETPASVWLEQDGAQFELLASEGLSRVDWPAQARGRLPDVARLLGAALPSGCTCAPIYPEDFAFCPNCGRALERLAGRSSAEPDWWSPWADPALPRQVPHGLPVTALALGAGLVGAPARRARSIPAPPNAHCVFAAARFGFPVQRLLALAVGRGVLQYWDPLARLWHVMGAEEGSAPLALSGSQFGWLPAWHPRRGEVAVLPTDAGLLRLWINPVGESYHTETVFEAPITGAPGALRRHVACLFAGAAGTRLWSAHADLANVALFECEGAPRDGWSRPIAYDGRLSWLHACGHLSWQPGEAPQWFAWPAGWTARLAFGGAVQGKDGRLWQIGHDGQGYSYLELFALAPERRALDGARLGFAGLLFRRGHAVLGEPWDVERVEELHEDDSLVLPLLRGFIDDRRQANGLVLRLHKYTGKAEDALGARQIGLATLEWIGQRNVVLEQLRHLARPQDCQPFVYDGCLWLHHPEWTEMRGWPLEGAP
ncbi:MAG: hypothetical protein V4508_12460 [Pseudomonadota bacterium]